MSDCSETDGAGWEAVKGLKNQLALHYIQWLCPISREDDEAQETRPSFSLTWMKIILRVSLREEVQSCPHLCMQPLELYSFSALSE